MEFRLASVSFLNALPLIEWFRATANHGCQVSVDLPSRLAARLESGSADLVLLPVAETFRGGVGGVLPVGCIACDGAVDSVKVFCRGELGDVHTVLADRGSRTSVALLDVLLRERHGIRARFEQVKPDPGRWPDRGRGLLVIGDRCFAFERALKEAGETGIAGHDLGAVWREWTGLPFVFAVWAVAPGFLERAGGEGLADLTRLMETAREYGLARLSEIAAREAAAGRLGPGGEATAEAIAYYFRHSLEYRLQERQLEGMRRFCAACHRTGVIPQAAMPRLL